MPVSAATMVSVQPRRGGITHITSLMHPGRTACGKVCKGWIVAQVDQSHVGCRRCKAAVFFKVKP